MLAKHYGFAPDVVSGMTIEQQLMYVEGISKKNGESVAPGRIQFDNMEDAEAYRQQRQAMLNG